MHALPVVLVGGVLPAREGPVEPLDHAARILVADERDDVRPRHRARDYRPMSELELRGDRLVLRQVVETDIPAMAAILTEPDVARWWGRYDADRVRREVLEDPQV